MSRHSRVKSSTTARMRKRRLSVRVSLRKSSDQRWFGPWGRPGEPSFPALFLRPPRRRTCRRRAAVARPAGGGRSAAQRQRSAERAGSHDATWRWAYWLIIDFRRSSSSRSRRSRPALSPGSIRLSCSVSSVSGAEVGLTVIRWSGPFRGRGTLWRGLAFVIHRWALA